MNDDLRAGSIAATITAACVAAVIATQSGGAPDAPVTTPQHVVAHICQGGTCMTCEGVAMPPGKEAQSRVLSETCQPVAPTLGGGLIGKLGGKGQPTLDRAATMAAITAPDSVTFDTGDDARASAGCACAPTEKDTGDPCQWTHPGGPGQGDVTEDAPVGVTLQAGTFSGNCAPKSCVEFGELTSLQGAGYSMPVECGGKAPEVVVAKALP